MPLQLLSPVPFIHHPSVPRCAAGFDQQVAEPNPKPYTLQPIILPLISPSICAPVRCTVFVKQVAEANP